MSISPDLPFPKSPGDFIRSKDWNDAIQELQRLDTDKVNKANDTIPGPLTISSSLNFGKQVRQMINLWSNNYGIGIQSGTQYFRTDRNFAWYRGGSHHDGSLNPGGGVVQMVIDDGNVGIGTSNPQSVLHVKGNAGILNMEGQDHTYIQWFPLGFSAGRKAWLGFGWAGTDSFTIRNDAGRMHIFGEELLFLLNKDGVIIGKEWGGNGNLQVQGTASIPGGQWTDSSDIALKTNVEPLQGALEKLLELRGVTFEWKEPEKHGNLTGTQMGMVAQEVEKVFPEWVETGSDGYKLMTTRGLPALIVEAIRSLEARIKTLEADAG